MTDVLGKETVFLTGMDGGLIAAGLCLPSGTRLANRYTVRQAVGSGRVGPVYQAYDEHMEQVVTVKEYLPGLLATRDVGERTVCLYQQEDWPDYQDGKERFLREALLLAGFREESGLVPVSDCFEDNETAYLVMPKTAGITLASHLVRHPERIPFERAIIMLSDVMRSLEAVHTAGVLHRNISPDTLLMDADGRLRLADFGMVQPIVGRARETVSVILKDGHAPLEQYADRTTDQGPWTDVFALATTLYRMLAGRMPPTVFDRLQGAAVPFPTDEGILMPADAQDALLKALSLNWRDRQRDVRTFLQQLCGGEQSLADGSDLSQPGGTGVMEGRSFAEPVGHSEASVFTEPVGISEASVFAEPVGHTEASVFAEPVGISEAMPLSSEGPDTGRTMMIAGWAKPLASGKAKRMASGKAKRMASGCGRLHAAGIAVALLVLLLLCLGMYGVWVKGMTTRLIEASPAQAAKVPAIHALLVTQLDLSDKGLDSIEDVTACKSLRRLDISGNPLVDLSSLAGMTGLRRLVLFEVPVEDLSALAGLSRLEELLLLNNPVQDLSPLSTLSNLKQLGIAGTRVTSLEPIQGLKSLRILNLDGSLIKDLKPVSGLVNLERLSMQNTDVVDVTPLAALARLREVLMAASLVTDTKPLRPIYPKLERVDFIIR